MNPGWWLLIGVILGVLGPWIARFLYENYMKPKMIILEDEPQEGYESVNHSIRIENKGKTVAINCSVLITITNMDTSDLIYDGGRPAHLFAHNYRPVKEDSLCWSFQVRNISGEPINPASLSIPPNSTRLIDFCRVHKGKVKGWDIEIPSEMGWDIRRAILRSDKEYEIELKIFADNVQYNKKEHRKLLKLIPDNDKRDVTIVSN